MVSDLNANERVAVVAKVARLSSPKEITKDDKTVSMQNCQIADTYGHCKIVLWQERLTKLVEGLVNAIR